ncbi:MAG: fibronectin type III domain-containing protein [Candidatus Nomurabacteria bacterium]|nr:MAG: fibronectin type III domain-containing protein [Candidatus Nomurabacteria bacterium]
MRHLSSIGTLLLLIILGTTNALPVHAQWVEPDTGEFPTTGGSTQAPLNTSNVDQTKTGSFFLQRGLTAENGVSSSGVLTVQNGNLRVTPDGGGQICLNGVCKSSLETSSDNYVRLSAIDPDLGFVLLGDGSTNEGYLDISSTETIGLYGIAGDPITKNTYGLLGIAGADDAPWPNFSAGVFGEAGANTSQSIGLSGVSPDPDGPAYAAYFKGRVNIVGCLEWNGGTCLNAWPSGLPSGEYVALLEDDDEPQIGNIDLSTSSTTVFTSVVLGDDPSGLSLPVTCGDGICNNSESGLTCAIDCFTIINLQVTNITDGSATVTWRTLINADSYVEYGLTSDFGSDVYDASMVTMHSLQIHSLNHDTHYYFRVRTTTGSGISQTSSIQSFTTLLDQTAPNVPANLRTTTPAPDRVPLAWFHSQLDNPGGSGFKEFIVYRDGSPYDTTGNTYYVDYFPDPGYDHVYWVTAVDNRNNESEASNPLIVHVPTPCISDLDCTDPQYPVCYGALGCGTPPPGGSPVMLKEIPLEYSQYQDPGGWDEGGGWY